MSRVSSLFLRPSCSLLVVRVQCPAGQALVRQPCSVTTGPTLGPSQNCRGENGLPLLRPGFKSLLSQI